MISIELETSRLVCTKHNEYIMHYACKPVHESFNC